MNTSVSVPVITETVNYPSWYMTGYTVIGYLDEKIFNNGAFATLLAYNPETDKSYKVEFERHWVYTAMNLTNKETYRSDKAAWKCTVAKVIDGFDYIPLLSTTYFKTLAQYHGEANVERSVVA